MKEDLRSFTLEECEELAEKLNWPSFRGRQIFQWVQQKGVEDIDSISNLSLDQRAVLSESTEISGVKLVFRDESSRGDTQKLLLEFPDRQRVEMALMLYSPQNTRDRATCCVSTQTGCKMGCAFCATGMFKENRNLSAGEIVSQVLKAREIAIKKGYEGITNVVYMGMGEPLLNLEAVRKSLLILNDAKGQNIGMRRMTVSTCGLIPQIYEMASWGLQIGLALSLHAPDDQIRSQLMPINKKYPINQLMEACKDYFEITGRRVTYEYALFKNVNEYMTDIRH